MTLEELITSMGYDFRELSFHTPKTSESYAKYSAKGGKNKLGHWTIKNGRTPLEAVLKLKNALEAYA